MPEPTSSAATATVVATSLVLPLVATAPTLAPQIIIFGVSVGLRADVLLAGFFGALAALAFFDTVPSSGDTLKELVLTTWRRMWHMLASAVVAGYLTPLMMLLDGDRLKIPEVLMLSVAFVVGAGARHQLAKFVKKQEAKTDAVAKSLGGGDA